MATILPTLTSHSDKLPMEIMATQSHAKNTVKNGKPTSQPVVVVRQMLNKRELLLQERRQASRAKLPELSEWQTNQFQNSYKQTLCVEMLQHGYHKSFSEIFGLIKQQADARISAGPDSSLWNQRPLAEEHDKLDVLKQYLMEAESADLTDDFIRVYQCHQALAKHFQLTGDKWLSDHFFENCLNYSMKIEGGGGRVAANGHCDVGLSLEKTGNVMEAARHFELCYELTKGNAEWMMEDDKTTMHSNSCNNLARIYTTLATQSKSSGNNELCLTYLTHAYEKAKEGGDKRLYGNASNQLGMAYVYNGRPDIALPHLQSFLETCQTLKDNEGIGKACEAIAKAHDSQGHVEESIKYLQRFVRVAEESKDDKSLCDACNSLGIRFNCLGRYNQSFDNSSRAYNIARTLNDTTRLRLSRVLTGISHAHQMGIGYTNHLTDASSRVCISRLLDWKDSRGDEFDKPFARTQDSAAIPDSSKDSMKDQRNEVNSQESASELEVHEQLQELQQQGDEESEMETK